MKNSIQIISKTIDSLLIALGVLMAILVVTIFINPMGVIFVKILSVIVAILISFSVIIKLTLDGMGVNDDDACFTRDTIIGTKSKSSIPIQDICPGDLLDNGSRVTATFHILGGSSKLYNLKNTKKYNCITNKHRIQYINMFIPVENHPESELCNDLSAQKYLYNINTDTKVIPLQEHNLLDWDDVVYNEIGNIKTNARIRFNEQILCSNDFHYYIDAGFHSDSIVEIQDKYTNNISYIRLADIKPGMRTTQGENIYGTVCIYAEDLPLVRISKNNMIVSQNVVKFEHINEYIPISTRVKHVYQVLTRESKITINGCNFFDYNYYLEQYL